MYLFYIDFFIVCLTLNSFINIDDNKTNELTENKLEEEKEELEWLVGFSEAESLFFISAQGNLSFRIKLHYDDRDTLVYIKKLLSRLANIEVGIIIDSKNKHESYLSVNKINDILYIIIPIFSKYYFTTTKYLDLQDFKAAAEIIKVSMQENRKLSNLELNEILKLKSGMNSSRKEYDISSIPNRDLTPYRVLGFIEGDGCFSLSDLRPQLSIKQHSKNIHFLHEIAEFLNKLPYNPSIGPKHDTLNTRPVAGVYVSDESSSLNISNILQLYNYILPFFNSLNFKSRKFVDFKYWEVCVKLKALGYVTLPQGKKLLVEISKYINKRYSTQSDVSDIPNQKDINHILSLPPIYNLASGLSYKVYSDMIKINKGGSVGYSVNVYDNNKLIEGSPFSSYTKAALALGNVNISSIISKKIDTGKLYKNRYKFESVYPDIIN